jgi:hypothetical protein
MSSRRKIGRENRDEKDHKKDPQTGKRNLLVHQLKLLSSKLWLDINLYKPSYVQSHPFPTLLRPNMFQLLVRPQEVIRICLRDKLPRIRLLHEILVSLLLRKSDRVFL